MRASLQLASEELVAFFTASCGGRGHAFEAKNKDFDPSTYDRSIVTEIDQARMLNRATPIAQFDAVRVTLNGIDPNAVSTLRLVYEPFGTWFSTGKHTESQRGRKRKADDDAPDCLERALRPSWGGGSFVRLAMRMPESAAAFRKQFDGKEPTESDIRVYLAHEAIEPGSEGKPVFKKLRVACELLRTEALKVYDVARKARVRAEAAEREHKQKLQQAAREAELEKALNMNRQRSRRRFERLLARSKSCPTP